MEMRGILSVAAGGLAAFIAVASAGAAERVGKVDELVLLAYGQPPGEGRYALDRTDPIHAQEVVETVREAAVKINFVDKTTLTLGSESRVVIDRFIYDPGGSEAAAIQLLTGAFRYTSGRIAEETVVITTPVANIGVRGTRILFRVAPSGASIISVAKGAALVQPTADRAVELGRRQSVIIDAQGRIVSIEDRVVLTEDVAVDRGIGVLLDRSRDGGPEGGDGGQGGGGNADGGSGGCCG